MKKLLFSIIGLFLTIIVSAQNIDAYSSFAAFNTPADEPYIESYIAINPNSLTYKVKDGKRTAGAEVTIILKQGDKIINFDKFDLLTEPLKDSTFITHNLIAQRRIAVPEGNYIYEVTFKDLNKESSKLDLPPQPLSIDFSDKVTISDIQLIEKPEKITDTKDPFYKNGFQIKPLLLDYYPTQEEAVNFYTEVYNDKENFDKDLVILSSIRKKGDNKPAPGFQVFSKQKGAPVNIVMGQLKIKSLPSGSYDLVVEVRDRENNLISKKVRPFQRSNKDAVEGLDNISMVDISNTFVESLTPEATVSNLRMVKPIATQGENNMILKLVTDGDTLNMKRFLYNFWVARNIQDPELSWKKYMVFIKYVNENYATVTRPGYETERGRVFLQYGPPTDIMQGQYESGSKPYEIWHYNRLPNNETDRIFVFYDNDLISNDYRLIHSNATGELSNEQWKEIVNRGNNDMMDSDNRDNFGNKRR